MVMFESVFSSIGFKRPLETSVLKKLSAIVPRLLVAFFVIRFGDLLWRGVIGEIFTFDFNRVMFVVENLIFIYAMIIMVRRKQKNTKNYLHGLAMVLAGALYRFNAYMIAYDPEWLLIFSGISGNNDYCGYYRNEIMAYLVFVKMFPVLPEAKHV